MNYEIYRILYCSRNSLIGTLEEQKSEIANILAKSRLNNGKRGITGALLFNSGYFAQVLEGPLEQVEQTFETIQRDMRHEDISVLECGTVAERDFPEWSMAYASGDSAESASVADLNLGRVLEHQTTAAAEISSLLRRLVVQDDVCV